MGRSVAGLREAVALLRVAYDRDVKYPAAALAYYAFVSLVPILMLSIAVFGSGLGARIEAAMRLYLTPPARELFMEAIVSVSGRTGGVLLSMAVLVWTGWNVTIGFQTVVDRIERVDEDPQASRLLRGTVILASLVLAGAVIVATSVISLRMLDGIVINVFLAGVALLAALTGIFLPLYYVPSRTLMSLGEAAPGAFVAATGWTVLHVFMRLYVDLAPQYAIYGTLSGVLLLLTSLYVAAMLLTFGVVVNWARIEARP